MNVRRDVDEPDRIRSGLSNTPGLGSICRPATRKIEDGPGGEGVFYRDEPGDHGRDFFGNVFEILEIHANENIRPL